MLNLYFRVIQSFMARLQRRSRILDSLASPAAVRSICAALRAGLPDLIPSGEKHLSRLLYAAHHAQRRPAISTKRGRPSPWRREDLLLAASHLRAILERETSGRVSLSSFVTCYLRVLSFPLDIADALSVGEINMQEAAQLARLCTSSDISLTVFT